MKNVLFIGETGVGKSSVINLILGDNTAGVSDKVERGTFATKTYPYKNFVLFDTVGYNDMLEKTSTEALTNLAKFVMNVNDNEGISLIVYVMKKGRINAVSNRNYDFFVKTVCKGEVPVLLVVTHCEDGSNPGEWYSSEQARFVEYGMAFNDAVCGSAVDLANSNLDSDLIPIYQKKNDRTQEQLRSKIEGLALAVPWKPTNYGEWVLNIFARAILFLGVTALAVSSATPGLVPILGATIVANIVKLGR